MRKTILAAVAAFAFCVALVLPAMAATYDVTITWTPDPVADTFEGWCSTAGLPDTGQTPTVSASSASGSVGLSVTGNGGETLSCVARQTNSSGPGELSDVASAVLQKPVPGKTTIFLEIRNSGN